MMPDAILFDLLKKLIEFPSITPKDEGCQAYIADYLKAHHFHIQHFPKGNVSNLFAQFGNASPLVVFAGHTDVVAPGELSHWQFSPFTLTLHDGHYFGRGVADMKGALAAMLIAGIQFIKTNKNFKGSIGFLLTSGEEGDDFLDGTPHVLSELNKQGIKIDYCIVGEPSSEQELGDTIKNGRRGSLTGYLTVLGKQGHVAYPHLAENAIHLALPHLSNLAGHSFDEGTPDFPKTTFQLTHLKAGVGSGNIVPGDMSCQFNLRFNTNWTGASLRHQLTKMIENMPFKKNLHFKINGEPFLTPPGLLIDTLQKSIEIVTKHTANLSTTGGTSDARFIFPAVKEVVEFGLTNETIHQHNENIPAPHLKELYEIYLNFLNLFYLSP